MTNKSTSGQEALVSHNNNNSVSIHKGLSQVALSDRLVVFHCNEGRLVNPGPMVSPDVASAYLPCTGRVDLATVLSCFRKGALGVLLAGCPEGACRFPHSNGQCSAEFLVSRVKRVIYMAGWDPRRVSFFSRGCQRGCVCSGKEPHEGSRALEKMAEEMIKELKELGMQPLSLGGLGSAKKSAQKVHENKTDGGEPGEQRGEQDREGRNSGEQDSDDTDSGHGLVKGDGLESGDGNGKVPHLVEEPRETDGKEEKIEDTRSGGEQ